MSDNHSEGKLESKLQSDCKDLAKESYKCSEKYGASGCQKFFDAYKECIKEERKRIIEGRRNGDFSR